MRIQQRPTAAHGLRRYGNWDASVRDCFPSINQQGPFAYAGTEPCREGLAVELTTKYKYSKQKKSKPRKKRKVQPGLPLTRADSFITSVRYEYSRKANTTHYFPPSQRSLKYILILPTPFAHTHPFILLLPNPHAKSFISQIS